MDDVLFIGLSDPDPHQIKDIIDLLSLLDKKTKEKGGDTSSSGGIDDDGDKEEPFEKYARH